MASYLIGHVTVKDEKLWQEYVAGVKISLDPYQSKIIFRGPLVSVLTGDHAYDSAVVIEFPDQSTLDNWYSSDKYQSLIPTRDKATDIVIMTY
jgi:uncharacterized protein (DUF1330 family)